MQKDILVLVGSNNDINKKGVPTKFVENLEDTIEKINSIDSNKQLGFHLDSCSADRTPFLLAPIINKKRYGGIIYHGGYSLVLGAAIQEVLIELRSIKEILDPTEDFEEFIKTQNLGKQYFPGILEKGRFRDSKYYHNFDYIPTIGVPGKDTPSQGVTALTSIAENPSGCEPRPVVGLGRVDTAVNCMYDMLYGMEDGFEKVTIEYESRMAKEGANSIKKRLTELESIRTRTIPSIEISPEGYDQPEKELVIYVGDNYHFSPSIPTEMEELDKGARLIINCPMKKDMTGEWKQYLDTLTQLNNTISVGVGNYDNAAILAAQLLNQSEVTAKMWQYRNGKTIMGVLKKPEWLQEFNIKGGK